MVVQRPGLLPLCGSAPLPEPCPALRHPVDGKGQRTEEEEEESEVEKRRHGESSPALYQLGWGWLPFPRLIVCWQNQSYDPAWIQRGLGMSSPCASRKCHIVCVLLSDTILRSPTLTTPPLHRSHPHDTPTCAHIRLCLSFYLGGHHSNPLSLLPHLHFLACLCPDLLWAPRAGVGGGGLRASYHHQPGICLETAGEGWWPWLFLSAKFHLQEFSLLRQPQSRNNLMIWF